MALGTRGGTCISVSNAFLSLVMGNGVIMPSRVQWVLLLIGGQKIGYLNVYAPNLRSHCTLLWKELLSWSQVAVFWVFAAWSRLLLEQGQQDLVRTVSLF